MEKTLVLNGQEAVRVFSPQRVRGRKLSGQKYSPWESDCHESQCCQVLAV